MKTKKPDSPLFTRSLYAIGQTCLAKDSLSPAIDIFRGRAAFLRATNGGGRGWGATAARLESGKLPAIFAKGNGKLPFYAFSSMAGVDCPQAGACLYGASGDLMGGFCYSFRAWRYPPAFARQLVNSLRLRSQAGRDAILDAWMALPPNAIVRLYVDGDFPSLDILAFWFRLCFARPDLQVYGYSKSWRILLDYAKAGGRFPNNYLLNLSSGGSGTDSEREQVSRLPIARGEFIAVPTKADHGKAYQSRRHAGFSDYARDVKQSAGRRVFVCSGKCGDCTPSGHACGSDKFRGIAIAIGIH